MPPEAKPQPQPDATALQIVPTGLLAPVTANTAALVKKRVAKAGRDFVRQVVALIENEQRGFYLKLCITLAYILLKIGDKDAYVDEVLATLNKKHKGVWVSGMAVSARMLGVSRATLWRMTKAGLLQKIEVLPGSFRLRRSDLEAIAAGQRNVGFSQHRFRASFDR